MLVRCVLCVLVRVCVFRGLASLRCCEKAVFSEWEAAKDDRSWERAMLNLNRYPTTITTISAAIRKLSQLTKVGSEPLAHWLLP